MFNVKYSRIYEIIIPPCVAPPPSLRRALQRVWLAFTAFFEVQALKNKQQLANQY